ncbi:hydrogenase nickel incorporation protein HypB [Desulfurispira natronophila]|uniref:Hydrogenase nickel incorporation protein HypB n=1 Tax=Desulfurispira natronophila TaxID=682562 RepID=A0A7W7Y2M8_9BACT|nr:hydrogenase nickel incorporation protein HypB [Desulfurispira natronophila]MBB5020965.1 hydrogenase nickel incorporation protein HypB [Desulfurispira natronophila]
MCTHCGCSTEAHAHLDTITDNPHLNNSKTIQAVTSLLETNNRHAADNRLVLDGAGVTGYNLMGSPGSGKTTLLEEFARSQLLSFAVIEGDLETSQDATRLQALGIDAYQITTGTACHLDAHMVGHAMEHIKLDNINALFVENVGNLVCPANFELGTHHNIVLLSVPEGHDKISKYPVIYRFADTVIITKCDLMDHFDFSLERIRQDLYEINPSAKILTASSRDIHSIRHIVEHLHSLRGN